MKVVNCGNCGTEMHKLGCRVTDLPWHYCVNCGSIKMCEEMELIVPIQAQNYKKMNKEAEEISNTVQRIIELVFKTYNVVVVEPNA